MESFPTLAAALNYAFQQDCNLIVEGNEGSVVQFEVMQDPDGACTAGLDLELFKTEDVLVEPAPGGWTPLMLRTLWDLTKRLAARAAALYVRQIVPLSRRVAVAASPYFRQIVPLSRRAVAFASLYLRQIVPLLGDTAARCWAESKSISRPHSWVIEAPHPSPPLSLAACRHQDSNICATRVG